MKRLTIAAVLVGLTAGCAQSTGLLDRGGEGDAAVVKEILDQTSAWAEANRRRDAQAVLDLFLDSDDLRHVENGEIFASYSALAEFVNGWYDTTTDMDCAWERRDVVPLATDAATMTGIIRFKATQKTGEVWSGRIVFTGVFVKRGGTWKLIHGHESSVPPPEAAHAPGDS